MRKVVYQLFVRHFGNFQRGGVEGGSREQNGCGTFAAVNDAALHALAEMGVTHLWLTGVLRHATQTPHPGAPAHPACVVKGLAGSPYAVTDYFDVDPDLAEKPERRLEEYRELLDRVRRWGMTPMMDFVPNHVSRCYSSPSLPEMELGARDRRDVFFHRDNAYYYLECPPGEERPMLLPDGEFLPERGCGRVTGNNAATWTPSSFDWYETVKLNYGCDYRHGADEAESLPGLMAPRDALPRTWLLLDEVLAWWQNMGVGGFRCDMAHMVPLAFWRWAIARARLRDAEVCFLAEAYNDNMKLMRGDPQPALLDAGFEGVYDADAYHALRALNEGGTWANDLDAFQRSENPLFHGGVRYVENHDEPRLASPQFWGGIGEATARALMTAQFTTTCGPILFYNGQELLERAEGPGGFGGHNGRTSIFDYTSLPRLQLWSNNGKFDGALLSPQQTDFRSFCLRLLRLVQHPALASGSFYGLNWSNQQTPGYGREDGESTSGHRLYSFLRHSPHARSTVLVVCNFSPQTDAHTCIHIPTDAIRWSRHFSQLFSFTDLLRPDLPPILASAEQLNDSGLPLSIPAGDVRILEWNTRGA